MDSFVSLAQKVIENYIKNRVVIQAPRNLASEFYKRRAGVFVTIYNKKDLRGCIGTFLPTKENIALEIIDNAISACSRDYRFMPITEKELPALNYEVSILSEPCPIKDLKKHNPKKHGIIVSTSDGRRGLLSPDLETIDTTEQQIIIASQKGGIDPFKDKIQLDEFTVEKHR